MGKLKLTNHNQEIKISFPKELAFIFKASKSRWFKNLIIFNPDTKVLNVIASDLDWKSIYFKLKRRYGHREVYVDMIHKCFYCKSLFWKVFLEYFKINN